MSAFFRMVRNGGMVETPLLGFLAPSLTSLDPSIPNLPLETAVATTIKQRRTLGQRVGSRQGT